MNEQRQTLPLKQAVQHHQNTLRLAPEQLEHLLAMQPGAAEAKTSPLPDRRRGLIRFVVAAGLVGAFLLGWLLHGPSPLEDAARNNPMVARVADEAARNHLKLKPVEIASNNMDDLRAYFQQLDFRPVQTTGVASAETELMGGRYCSLQGGVAAQLRLKSPGGGLQTVYQTRYDPEVFGVMPNRDQGAAPISVVARGVPVSIWVEQGLLFALTGASEIVRE